MSSILKALEKVERERAARRDGLSADLITPRRRQRSPWMLPTGICAGAGLAALITFAAMGGFSHHQTAPSVIADSAPETRVAPDEMRPAPVAASTVPVVKKPAAVRPTEPAGESWVTVPNPAPPKLPREAAVKQAAAPVPHLKEIAAPPPLVKQVPVPSTVPALSSVPASAPPVSAPVASPSAAPRLPRLRVSGIAVQNNGDASFAIVNGRPVAKGGAVEGCRVEEILPDRVRFSNGGKNFEITMEEEGR